MPVRLDAHLYYQSVYFVRDLNGLAVSAFDIFFFLAFACWLFRIVSDRGTRIRLFPGVTIPYLLIWVISLAGLLKAGVDAPIAVAAMWTVFKCYLVFLYTANNLERLGSLQTILIMLLVVGIGQSLLGLAQYATGGRLGLELFGEAQRSYFEMRAGAGHVSRVAGTLGHPNKLAVFLNLLIQMNIALLFGATNRRARRLLLVPLVLMGLAMVLTYSRGGWLGLAFGGWLTLFWCLMRIVRHRTVATVILLTTAMVLALSTLAAVPSVRKRLFEEDYGTAALRGPMSQVALNVIAHHPLLGVGLNNYTAMSQRYDNTRTGVSYSFPKPVHNEFLLIGAEQGLVVLGLFLAIVAQMFVFLYHVAASRISRTATYAAIGFFGGLMGWCLHHQFEYEYTFFSATTWLLFGLFQALYVRAREQAAAAENGEDAALSLKPSELYGS